jgi:hypothetical protein
MKQYLAAFFVATALLEGTSKAADKSSKKGRAL